MWYILSFGMYITTGDLQPWFMAAVLTDIGFLPDATTVLLLKDFIATNLPAYLPSLAAFLAFFCPTFPWLLLSTTFYIIVFTFIKVKSKFEGENSIWHTGIPLRKKLSGSGWRGGVRKRPFWAGKFSLSGGIFQFSILRQAQDFVGFGVKFLRRCCKGKWNSLQ